MTELQRETIRALKEEIMSLKVKFRHIGKEEKHDKKFHCFICNKSWEDDFVCSECIQKDIERMDKKIRIVLGKLEEEK